MKIVGLSKMGLNSTRFYGDLLNRDVDFNEVFITETINLDNNYDFILFDGGSDVTPFFYGEETRPFTSNNVFRDNYEKNIFHRYKNTKTKFVGICRGLQFLNVMYGGTLYQDLVINHLNHTYIHDIEISQGFGLENFLPKITSVNSMHHQAIKILGKGLIPIAFELYTRIIEAIVDSDDKVRAVQFHPEFMSGFPYTKEIIKWLFRYY